MKAAEASKRAAYGTRLPSLAVEADFGDIGQTVASAKQTFTVTANVTVPIFEGGRTRARVQQADAALRQEQAQLDDFAPGSNTRSGARCSTSRQPTIASRSLGAPPIWPASS